MRIATGVTDQTVVFEAVDSVDFNTPETGLSSFTVWYDFANVGDTQMSGPTTTEIDATNMPGLYRLLVDESGMVTLSAGDDTQELALRITKTGMRPVVRVIEIYRPETTAGNTLGVESDGDVTKVNALDGHTAQTGDTYALANGATGFDAIDTVVDLTQALAAGATGFAAIDTVVDLTQALAAGATGFAAIDTVVDAVKAKTDNLPTDPADQSLIIAATDAIVVDLDDIKGTSFVKDTHSLIDIQVGVAAIPTTAMRGTDSAATAASVAALNDVSVADVLTTQMTEAYAADGAAPTLAQALMMIQQKLGEFSISGTTLTMKKLDGSATAATFTLDDATSPTSITRAT